MAKKKVAVAISDWLLVQLDEQAQAAEVSRSSMVEEAVAEYVTARKLKATSVSQRQAASEALQDMRRFASEYAQDPIAALEPSALEKLRSLRAQGPGL